MMLQTRPAPVVSGLCGPLVVRCRAYGWQPWFSYQWCVGRGPGRSIRAAFATGSTTFPFRRASRTPFAAALCFAKSCGVIGSRGRPCGNLSGDHAVGGAGGRPRPRVRGPGHLSCESAEMMGPAFVNGASAALNSFTNGHLDRLADTTKTAQELYDQMLGSIRPGSIQDGRCGARRAGLSHRRG
jgi:hypothetical protein